jgi:hypothetical protein
VLDDPPPLTPANLSNFPYRVRPFPWDVVLSAGRAAATLPPARPANAVE